jgi:hypothetical protein
MIANSLLLDVIPGPPSPGVTTGEMIFVGVVVLMLTGAAIVGFIFFLRWLLRMKPSGTQAASQATAEFQPNSPNQP